MTSSSTWRFRLEEVIARCRNQASSNAFWREFTRFNDGTKPVEGAVGGAWMADQRIHALAVMTDSDVFNTATGRGAKTWTTGDVLEFFIQPDGSKSRYFEFHVTPSGAALSLRIDDASSLRADCYRFDALLYESDFSFEYGRWEAGWWAHADVSAEEIGLRDAEAARCCLCRYNYHHAWPKPELSSTAQLTGLTSFHHPECWHSLTSDPPGLGD
ncbi:MAG TPA: hypothetical protein PKE26_05325 [Kiritimatiellia bacterium]|nr:hypothetical protein [Kiritimatiellia bacterium]HMO98514.1 hypothetical protein [Kiritimatiellia bacterium]HMP95822.1 hypothetical protein [Kiritimatiellia bacterium]